MSSVSTSREPDSRSSFPIVGIGASAGGLEAISQFLKALPADTGMGFVVVQHLAPQSESILSEILKRTTTLSVLEATGGRTVEPNHIYVIPPNADLEISRGILQLSPRPTGHVPHLPIDHFFASLAEDSKEKSVGIVLSGSASDGTLGLKAIKSAGGITFAQEEATAKYGSMPHHAIAAGYVDFVLPPNQIALELSRIRLHPYVVRDAVEEPEREAVSENDLVRIYAVLKNATGVDFVNYKEPTVIRRINGAWLFTILRQPRLTSNTCSRRRVSRKPCITIC